MAENDDSVRDATDELYSADPGTFTERRAALAAAAKKAGNGPGAKQIAALRKPTRSAYTVNALARSDPDGIAELVELGEQLRQAERSVDPQQIRELTAHRRQLVNDLTRRAFAAIDDQAPGSAVRDEVVSTLTAALADPDVAAQIAGGTLVKPARWEGFGFGGAPDLTVVGGSRDCQTGSTSTASQRTSPPRPSMKGMSQQDREVARREADQREAERKARERAAAQEAERVRIADAQQAVDDAEEAHLLATDEERTRVERLRELEEEVAQARRAVDEARIQLRRAEIRQRRARDALGRIGG